MIFIIITSFYYFDKLKQGGISRGIREWNSVRSGGTPFCKENSFIDTARDVGSQGSGCKPMLADVMNRKWRVGLLKKTPTEGEEGCGEGEDCGLQWETLEQRKKCIRFGYCAFPQTFILIFLFYFSYLPRFILCGFYSVCWVVFVWFCSLVSYLKSLRYLVLYSGKYFST